jgi:hypothetical protein
MFFIFLALVAEHLLCRSSDLARINLAFFQMNALVGLVLVIGVGWSLAFDWVRAMDDYFIWHTSNHFPWTPGGPQ